MDTNLKEMMTALPDKHYSGHHRATEIHDKKRTCGKEIPIWRKKCGQQISGAAEGRWRCMQHRTELDENKYSSLWPMLHQE